MGLLLESFWITKALWSSRLLALLVVTFYLSSSTLFAQKLDVNPSTVTVMEGSSGEFTVKLSKEPSDDVTVTLMSIDGLDLVWDKTTLTFTRRNWNIAQTVRVSTMEDADAMDNRGRIVLIANGGGYGDGGGIIISPERAELKTPGDTLQLMVRIQDQSGSLLSGVPLEWQSADSSVAMVDSTGMITAVGEGTTVITATLASASGRTVITVGEPVGSDRKILEQLFYSTGGEGWTRKDGWLTDAPLRMWYGIQIDDDGFVTSIDLPNNNLEGTIPPDLGGLTRLETLSLRENNLTGTLPLELGNLEELRQIDLGELNLSGEIPATLGNLVELRRLNFELVPFTGSIPPELGKLVKLEYLDLYLNRLSGSIPAELAGLRSLQTMLIDGNQLTGSIPSTFVRMEELQIFSWNENDGLCAPATAKFETWRYARSRYFHGPRCNETDLAVLKQLYDLTDGVNWTNSTGWLNGAAVEQWHGIDADSLGHVTVLDLENNELIGKLPQSLQGLDQLSVLKVGGNLLSGRIPLLLTSLALEEFSYAGTGLCVPQSTAFLQWLSSISLHEGTELQCPPLTEREILTMLYETTGGKDWKQQDGWLTEAPLSSWFGIKTNGDDHVVELALSGNNLRGRLLPELAELVRLAVLDLSFNWLEGTIPLSLGNIATLEVLRLNSNLLKGPIPVELGSLSRLTELGLFENQLEGIIPPELGSLRRLTQLDLLGNYLEGGIPQELGALSNLSILRISQNRLTGRIPAEIGNLSKVEVIWLDDNLLEGEIPPELGKLSSVRYLYLGYNQLSGSIPPEFGNLRSLTDLGMDGNLLTGMIPAELGSLPNLTNELNLRENNLSGEIPPELGKLTRLKFLRLGYNNFSGSLSPIGQMNNLDWLDLSHNPQLVGPLPSSFANLHSLGRFEAEGTTLCIANGSTLTDPAIVRRFRLPLCDPPTERSTAYLIQSIQSARYPIPLVANEDALLRVFPISPAGTNASIPPARATFYVDGAEVHAVDIPGQTTQISTELMHAEASLDRSANVQVPGSVVQPGLEMVVEIDPGETLDSDLELIRRIPDSGRTPVQVEALPTFDLTLVPFIWRNQPDLTAADLAQEMEEDPEGHRLLWDLRTLMPVSDIAVTAHPPVLTSKNSDELLDEVGVIRALEGGTGYWMGALSGESTGYWGVAWIDGWTSYMRLGVVSQPEEALTLAHELGHSMSLRHAPCGTSSVLDAGYPYPDAAIGNWGLDTRSEKNVLVPPTVVDLMSYCVPAWVSEYNFLLAMRHRLSREAVGKTSLLAGPALLLWGGTDQEGTPYLNPVFALEMPPLLPTLGGQYQLEGRSTEGELLFSLSFDMKEADHYEERGGFTFAIPSNPEWIDTLAEVSLVGPGGSTTIDVTTNRPATILQERTTGYVRAILWHESATMAATNIANTLRSLQLQPDLEIQVLYSRGIPRATEALEQENPQMD